MKVLIRQKVSGLYYGSGGKWVSDRAQAVDFKVMENAIGAAQQQALSEASILFRSEQPECEVCVPLDRFLAGTPQPQPPRMKRLARLGLPIHNAPL